MLLPFVQLIPSPPPLLLLLLLVPIPSYASFILQYTTLHGLQVSGNPILSHLPSAYGYLLTSFKMLPVIIPIFLIIYLQKYVYCLNLKTNIV